MLPLNNWPHFPFRGRYSAVFGTIGAILCIQSSLPQNILRMASSYVSGSVSVAYVTAPSEEVAKKIATGLVQSKMAACVNIMPKVTSIYEWEGKINEDSEVLMMIKTRSSKVQDLVDYVKANHPYDCPEVISLPVESGSADYLKWVEDIVAAK